MNKLLPLLPLVISLCCLAPLRAQTETFNEGGKTFGNEINFADNQPPHLRITSKDSAHGGHFFDAFILVKAKLNGVYDIRGGLQDQETFNVGRIDVWGTDDSRRFWMDIHQTQIRFRAEHQTKGGPLIGYLELDAWGGDKGVRARHIWVDYKFFHLGQDWSFFGDKEIWPNVLDWDGPPSGVWRREPSLIFYHNTKSNWRFEGGIENPGAGISFAPFIDSSLSSANQPLPDFIATVKKFGDWGHIRLAGIYRKLTYRLANLTGNSIQSVPGYGLALSGFIKTNQRYTSPIQFQFVAGRGIATYLVSFGGLNYDAAPNQSGGIEAIPTFGGWASYELFFSKQLHFNFISGISGFFTQVLPAYSIPEGGLTATNSSIDLLHYYGLFNLMYTPIPVITFGIEYNLGFKNTIHRGELTQDGEMKTEIIKGRKAERISFGLFYDF